jgi:YD repeat-containing protein
MLCQKSKQRGSSILAEHYHYPMDSVFASLMGLATGSYYLPTLSKDVYYNNTLIEKTEWQYGDFTVNNKTQKLLNTILLTRQSNTEVVLSDISYTPTGQIKRYKKIDEPITWLSWALNDNYLVIKYQGNDPLVNRPVSNNMVFNRNDFLQEMNYRCGIGYPSLFVGYSYYDHNGVSSSTNQRGITTFYDYNKAHQLESVRDDNSQLLKTFEYNFKNK